MIACSFDPAWNDAFESRAWDSVRPFARCEMSGEQKDDDVDQTPEYPLPSPTDPLGRDELPLEDEDAEE